MGNITAQSTSTASSSAQDFNNIIMLGASELREVLSAGDCLAALEEAYANLHTNPEDDGQSLGFKTAKGKFHVKSGLSPRTHKYFAAKVNANFPQNAEQYGLPTIQGLIVLCACDNGRPVAILQSGELTGRRTAAATALAAKHGARSNSRTVAMIGCGAQAVFQAEALLDILPIEKIIAFDNDQSRAKQFVSWAERKLGVAAETADRLKDAVRICDICVTCTTSTQAIVDAAMVPKGCFIAAVGADNPDKQELDPDVFVGARIIVDDLEQCLESGDMAHARRAGVAGPENVTANLAQLAAGVVSARTSHEQIVIFDSTGVGLQDVAAAAAAYERTQVRGHSSAGSSGDGLIRRAIDAINRHIATAVPRHQSGWVMFR